MADNTTLNSGTGGDTIRDLDRAGVKTPIVALDLNPAGAETLMAGAMPVTGTFWQATQPVSGTVTADAGTGTFAVSAASLPLPAGAATSAKQPALGTAGSASADVLTIQGIASMTAVKVDGSAVTQPVSGTVGVSGSVAVTGTFWQATQPVSAASLPLPAGAATSAKQPALGTAGSAAADVLTIQGIASMTAVKVDGSAVTQPVSGTVTANVGTTNGLALDATLTGGTQKTKLVDSGGTNVASVSAAGAVKVDGSAVTQPVSGTFWQATQPVSGTVAANPAAAASGGATPYHLISAASTNATSVKGSAGVVYSLSAFNTNASARYLKLYDKASSPTVGTDTPVATYLVPPSNGGFTLPIPVGIQLSSGIALAITGAMGDSDTTAIGAGDVCVALSYK